MKSVAATLVVTALCWTAACPAAGPATPVLVDAGKTVSLKPGESAQARDGILRVGFDGVTADSRCRKGEQCVWAGDATVRVWLQRGSGAREALELHTQTGVEKGVFALDHQLRLVRLDPVPIAGKAIAQHDYVATLTLAPGSTADPER